MLGEIHDCDVMLPKVEGIESLEALLRTRRELLFARFRELWEAEETRSALGAQPAEPSRSERLALEAQHLPLVHAPGAEPVVEAERQLVPVQRRPFDPRQAALDRERRDPREQRPADARPCGSRAARRCPRSRSRPCTRSSRRCRRGSRSRPPRRPSSASSASAVRSSNSERAQHLGVAVDFVAQFLVGGELEDQPEEGLDVLLGHRADRQLVGHRRTVSACTAVHRIFTAPSPAVHKFSLLIGEFWW